MPDSTDQSRARTFSESRLARMTRPIQMHGGASAHPSVAVLGAGRWGINHARVFAELDVLAAICDSDAVRIQALAERYPGVRMTSSIGELLDDPSITAVVLATPAITHAYLTAELLYAGKHVLVEKPM